MIKKIIRKVLNKLFLRHFDDIKIQKGQIFEKTLVSDLKNIKSLNQTYFKVFSQDVEDGIIQYLLKSLDIKNVKFVEIGTQDYSESNTRYIFETMRCNGLIIDPTPNLEKKISSIMRTWKNNLKIYNKHINSNNISNILTDLGFDKELDIFSIDIDGIDFWVLEKLNPYISKIVIAEYNPYFGPNLEISAPNIDAFDRFKYHYTGFCWGASLKALVNLMRKKNFTFIGTNRLNCNAFFVSNNLVKKLEINIPDIKDLSKYTDVNFKVLKTFNKQYANYLDVKDEVNDLQVFDLSKNKLVFFRDLSNSI